MTRVAKFPCPNCPRDLLFREEYVGHRVACRFCGFPFRLPRHVLIPCPSCAQEGKVRSTHLGRKIRCKGCTHAFRAKVKHAPADRSQPSAMHAAEFHRLQSEIDRRDAELAEVVRQLIAVRRERMRLDEQIRSLTDDRDTTRGTEEVATLSPEPQAESPSSFGTQIDVPWTHVSFDHPHADLDDRSGFDLPKPPITGLSPEHFSVKRNAFQRLKDESARLREELETLREKSDTTVVSESGGIESLERSLAIANADNVRLSSERDEAVKLTDAMRIYLRDRETMLAAAVTDRDQLKDELETLRRDDPASDS